MGKLISKIICAVVTVILAAAITVLALTSGQMRTIEKLCSAVANDSYKDYCDCFAENADFLQQGEFDTMRNGYKSLYGEKFGIKSDFVSRSNVNFKETDIVVEITFYGDNGSNKQNTPFHLINAHGKWVIV